MPPMRATVLLALAVIAAAPASTAVSAELFACDLITLREPTSEGRLTDEAWIAYTTALAHVLADAGHNRQPAEETNQVIAALQEQALKSVAPARLAAFRASADCRLLVDLSSDATGPLSTPQSLLPEFRPHATTLTRLTRAALQNLESELSRIRFRTEADRTRFRAATYCHVASLVYSASVRDSRRDRLGSFGRTVGCAVAGRKE